jgi:hypothetical protein
MTDQPKPCRYIEFPVDELDDPIPCRLEEFHRGPCVPHKLGCDTDFKYHEGPCKVR